MHALALSVGTRHRLGLVRLVMLIGSGASKPAGLPSVSVISDAVFSGSDVVWSGDSFRIAQTAREDPNASVVDEVVGFVNELRDACDQYFAAVKVRDREANYEDVAYIAQQIADAITSEYENAAVFRFIQHLTNGHQTPVRQMDETASRAVFYIQDVVAQLLSKQPGKSLAHMAPIVGASKDASLEKVDLFTLNHDLLIEAALDEAGVEYSDGFERRLGDLELWSDKYSKEDRGYSSMAP